MRLRRRPTVAVLSALALLVLAAQAHALPAAKAGSGGEAPRDSVQQAQVGGALWDRVQADQLGEALLGETYRDACPAATAGHARCFARLATSVLPDAASAPVSAAASGSAVRGYGPADLRSAYALPSTTRGAGQTVAIVAAFDHPDAESDLAHYRSFFGLPSCTRANGCFRKVNQRGGSTPPRADAGWAQEISLDLDMVSAVCPRCHLLLVEADSNSLANLGAAVSRAASMGAKVISNSYGAPESQGLRNANAAFNHPGHVLTAAAGDSGFGLSFPASSQYVTAVGGTRLTRSSNARGWTESVWSGTGSGCSRVFPKPSWQTDGGCPGRTVADVSAVADPATGVAMYHTFGVRGGPWFKAGGTSVSAPIIAGVYALAGNAGSVRYGSFPHPSVLAKMAVTVDHISGGRVEVGLGAGWHGLEHTAYGFDMPSSKERVARLAEQLEIVNREWSDGPFDFHGTYFRLEDLDALPKPVQRPRPNLIVGGSAGPRSAALAARWADEYNTTLATLEQCRQRRQRVASAWDAAGRDPDTLRFSLMTTCVVGRDRAELRERLGRLLDRTGRGGTAEALIQSAPEHWILGTVDQVAERLRGYEAAGVQRVMLQHLVHDDLDMVALIGDAVVPAVA